MHKPETLCTLKTQALRKYPVLGIDAVTTLSLFLHLFFLSSLDYCYNIHHMQN